MTEPIPPRDAAPAAMDRRGFLLTTVAAGVAGYLPYAADAAQPAAMRRFGAQTHYGQQDWHKSVSAALARQQIGVARARDELYWAVLEKQRGVYDWDYGDRVMAQLAADGVPVILGFDFGNPLYNSPGKEFPDTPQARAAFADYVMAVLTRYAGAAGRYPGLIEAVEVWNEANGHWGGGYSPREVAPLLAQLTIAVADRVRGTPDFDTLPILGCATVKVPLRFIQWCFDAGIGAAIDKVVIHPYGPAESLLQEVAWLRQQLDADGHDQAIWATEFGNLTDADQMLKTLAAVAASPIEKANYYLSQSDSAFATGLIGADGAITPVGQAWRAWATDLDGAAFEGRASLQPQNHALRFRLADGRIATVCWSHWGQAPVLVRGAHQVFDSVGTAKPPASRHVLTPAPLVLIGDVALISDTDDGTPIAEAFGDFAFQQGHNGWSYHFDWKGQTRPLVPGRANQYGTAWGLPDGGFASISAGGAHPALIDGQPVQMIRRWTAAQPGTVRVQGYVSRAAQGDGVDVAIRQGGTQVFSADALLDGRADFDLTLTLAAAETLDFVTGPRSDQSFDTTDWRILISAPPVKADI